MSEPLVTLVDETGNAIGTMAVTAAHSTPGTLHLAFSVMVTDDAGRMLLQLRHADKVTFGGTWANACCSHPRPGEPILDAARRRVHEELGVELVDAREIGSFTYRAVDPRTGMVEHERDVVVVGSIEGSLDPDATEIGGLRWLTVTELETTQLPLAPWFEHVLRITRGHMHEA